MAVFHVFVDGATNDSLAGLETLADAIASHYGLGAADLLLRLRKGRFRVKGNTDRETADTYSRDLQRLGAQVTIEEATAENSQRTTPLPFPAVRPDTPPAGNPVVRQTTPPTGLGAAGASPPSAGARPTTPPATGLDAAGPARASTPPPISGLAAAGAARASTPPPTSGLAAAGPARVLTPPPMGSSTTSPPPMGASTTTPPPMGGQFQSGLSAAFSGEMPAADLGALGSGDAAFSLASLDGVEDNSESGGSIGPPPSAGGLPASIGPAPDKAKAKAKASGATPGAAPKAKDEPLDMFAPPDMQGEEEKVTIAADEDAFSARKRASTPPPTEQVPAEGAGARPSSQKIPTTPAIRKSQPLPIVPNESVLSVPSKLGPLANERVRFAAGVLLAVLLGFIPAHFIAKMKEESSNETIDRKIIAAQQQADTPEVYANLDRMRADQLDRKEAEHRNAAIIGFAIWALAGGGIAFGWFKKIPWDA